MALDIQTIAMTPSYVPYERPPQEMTLWSAIPRGLQSFIVPTALLDAKALNDEALLQLTATLPPNFGYVMTDLNFTIAQDRAFDWNGHMNLNLQNFYRASVNESVALAGNWRQEFRVTGPDPGTLRVSNTVQPYPSFPIIGSQGTSGVLIVIIAHNDQAAAALAGTVNAFISFWQFDLEQIRKYPINSPIPTHAR